MGRPSIQGRIDPKELQELMKFYPSKKEAGDWFDVSEKTLERFINKTFKVGFDALRAKSFVRTKISLKRAQWKKALAGDNTMMIWLGKQYLGQQENPIPDDTEAEEYIAPDSMRLDK